MSDSNEAEWLLYDVTPSYAQDWEERDILPFPAAIVKILQRQAGYIFDARAIDADVDEFNQWRITLSASYYGNDKLLFKWTGVGLTFEDAQNALVRFMNGWWFEADL